ncbi:MAG: DedA family protein [Desulfovibrio sp.]|nr:DedA family protein [Desulfovibrio sp.]
MVLSKLVAILRAHWGKILIGLLLLGLIGHLVYHSGQDPARLLGEWGYLVILVWTFVEGETIVVLAGWLSESVNLKPHLIALCAFCGSFASDQVMFSLGKHKGEDVLAYFPRVARNLDKAKGLFQKYDTALILGFRFVYGVRNITPIMLGLSGVSHKKFFFLNAIGAGVWAVSFTYGGLYAGKAFMHVMDRLGYGIFFLLLAVLAAAFLIWRLRRKKSG